MPESYEWRVARLERDVDEIQKTNHQAVILERLENLSKRVDRMAMWSMGASGLLVAALSVLLTLIR